MNYKRHQVISVLYALVGGPPRTARERLHDPATSAFKTRIKRLLEADLVWARKHPEKAAPANLAFFDTLPSGSGQDVSYSAFRAFNLAVALELLRVGGKQGEVVDAVALLQPELRDAFEKATTTIQTHGRSRATEMDSNAVSDGEKARDAARIFLVMRRIEVTARGAAVSDRLKSGENLLMSELLYGFDNFKEHFRHPANEGAYTKLVIEVSELAARIVELLKIEPQRKRGRQ